MFLYLITNKKNGKIYIGQTSRLTVRWREHLRHAKYGCPFPLHRAIRKYGSEHFVFTAIQCGDRIEANNAERYLISILKDTGILYNITDGGEGGSPFLGKNHSKKTKRKISDSLKGKKRSKKIRTSISVGLKGIIRSTEFKKKITGSRNGMFGRFGKLNPMFGKKRPDVSKRNRKRRYVR